jgi:putative addiction module component (TIGR02574 family)
VPSIESLLEAAMALSDRERAELADRLYETLPADKLLYEAEWIEECGRRMAMHDADPSSSIPWDEAMKMIFAPTEPK